MKKIAQFISMEFSLFWNGKISLPWMYWFWGIVVWNLIKFGTIFLVAEPFPLILYIGVPYALVWMVGTWRSANNYKGPKFWANLTKLVIIIPIIILVFVAIQISSL